MAHYTRSGKLQLAGCEMASGDGHEGGSLPLKRGVAPAGEPEANDHTGQQYAGTGATWIQDCGKVDWGCDLRVGCGKGEGQPAKAPNFL